MAEQALAKTGNDNMAIIEQVVIKGNLAELKPMERVQFYNAYCESLGLNPVTRPFEYIEFKRKVGGQDVKVLALYPKKECTEQLRSKHGISIYDVKDEMKEIGKNIMFKYTAYGRTANGRVDQAVGVVVLDKAYTNMYGDAMMKAETKAKRRLTLSMVGLGFMADFDDTPHAKVTVDAYGAVVDSQPITDPDEAVEGEVVDEGKAQEPKNYEPPMANESQLEALKKIAANLEWSGEQVNAFISMREGDFRNEAHYPDNITQAEASRLISAMQKEVKE